MMAKDASRGNGPQNKDKEQYDDNAFKDDSIHNAESELDFIALRISGIYADIKEYLSNGNAHDETHRRLYFTATALDTLLNYLDEREVPTT